MSRTFFNSAKNSDYQCNRFLIAEFLSRSSLGCCFFNCAWIRNVSLAVICKHRLQLKDRSKLTPNNMELRSVLRNCVRNKNRNSNCCFGKMANDIRISRIYGNEVRTGQQVVELEVVEMRWWSKSRLSRRWKWRLWLVGEHRGECRISSTCESLITAVERRVLFTK